MNTTLTPEEAFRLGTFMRCDWIAVTLGYKLRIWELLDYESWEEYLTCEHGELNYQPGRFQNPDLAFWASYGMSVEAISRITALDSESICAELAALQR